MSDALQSAQQAMQQAGQQQAKQGGGKEGEQEEASDEEWGQEFKPGGQGSKQASGQGKQQQGQQTGSKSAGVGGGMGGPGIGQGGRAGAQQPLPGPKKDDLVRGTVNSKGKQLSRTYMGTPDPTKDKAAYFSIVPDKVRAAEASLNREEIPTTYKKQVQQYFESIQPK